MAMDCMNDMNSMKLMKGMKYYITQANLIIDHGAREWCTLPYPLHSRGCPNYGHKYGCPPKAPLVEDTIDLDKPCWLVIIEFNLGSHIARMLSLHPDWSNRQARCVLYWQGGVNRELKLRSFVARLEHPNTNIFFTPEAMGVHIIKTMQNLGFPIEMQPTQTVFKVALLAQGQRN